MKLIICLSLVFIVISGCSGGIWDEIASGSGGTVINPGKGDVDEVLKAVLKSLLDDSVYVQRQSVNIGDRKRSRNIFVDSTISKMLVKVTSKRKVATFIPVTIYDHAGKQVSIPSTGITDEVNVKGIRMIQINKPNAGVWKVKVGNILSDIDIVVEASSKIDFDYKFNMIKPFSGKKVDISVTVGDMKNISKVSALLQQSQLGHIIVNSSLVGMGYNKFVASTEFPVQEFYLVLEGIDILNNRFLRFSKTPIKPIPFGVVTSTVTSGNVVAGGVWSSTTDFWNFKLRNTLTIHATSSVGKVTVSHKSPTLLPMGSSTVETRVTIPKKAKAGKECLIDIQYTTNTGYSEKVVSKFKILHPDYPVLDNTKPKCVSVKSNGSCSVPWANCTTSFWQAHYKVQDLHSGLLDINLLQPKSYKNTNYRPIIPGVNNTVDVEAHSNCCDGTLAIKVMDRYHNDVICTASITVPKDPNKKDGGAAISWIPNVVTILALSSFAFFAQ